MEPTKQRDLIYLNALNCLSVLGSRRINVLLNHFGSAEIAWQASGEEYKQVFSIRAESLDRLINEKKDLEPEKEWYRLAQYNIKCLSSDSDHYPELLKQISYSPPILYYIGNPKVVSGPAIAIVGSRRSTFYGQEVAQSLGCELAAAGMTVISGMALGVDTSAHRGALESGGYTAAVLGCGLDCCYPRQNQGLMTEIAAKGIVISEFPLGTSPMAANFPQRNRIISGLSLGTVVVEATAKSGSLITANYALEQNREVFAVPGNIGSPYSRGCHRLIKEGAKLVECAADILEELNLKQGCEEQLSLQLHANDLPAAEKKLLQQIPYQPMHIDDLIRISGFGAAEASSLLVSLEIKKLIRQMPGKYFCRI